MKVGLVKQIVVILSLTVFGFFLLSVVAEMPTFGEADNPPNLHLIDRYIEKGEEESGAKNIITNIILNYRGYDTMGETTVIFTALCAVLAILKREDLRTSFSLLDTSPNQPGIVVRVIITLLFPLVLLFGFFVILHGEDSPGGGFQGGTVVAAAFILYALVYGFRRALETFSPGFREFFESIAPLTFFGVGILGLFFGLNFLTFVLPGIPKAYQIEVARFLISIIEIGIGVGGWFIFTSIFFSMQREEK